MIVIEEKYYFIVQIYYFNEQNRKIKVWDVGSIIKQDGIIDKVVFWDSKIEWDKILGCECSKWRLNFNKIARWMVNEVPHTVLKMES